MQTEVRKIDAATRSQSTSLLLPSLLYIRLNPEWNEGFVRGQEVQSATLEQAPDVSTYRTKAASRDEDGNPILIVTDEFTTTWATDGINKAIADLNAKPRWEGFCADYVPSDTPEGAGRGQTVGEENARLLGNELIPVLANTEFSVGCGFGVREASSLGGCPADTQVRIDEIETDIEFGSPAVVRKISIKDRTEAEVWSDNTIAASGQITVTPNITVTGPGWVLLEGVTAEAVSLGSLLAVTGLINS